MSALEPVHNDATFRIYSARNIQVNLWADAPTVDQMRAFGRIGAAHSRRHPQGAALLNLITSGTPSFSEAVRDETVRVMKVSDMFRLGAAHLVLLEGFKGTAVRAFLSTVMLLGRPPIPNKVFGDAESAAAWMIPLLAPGAEAWSPVEIVSLVKQATARR
jgi:hypothetical protein